MKLSRSLLKLKEKQCITVQHVELPEVNDELSVTLRIKLISLRVIILIGPLFFVKVVVMREKDLYARLDFSYVQIIPNYIPVSRVTGMIM
ncbi:hypothetical protein GLOIN_2v1874455 [Rhizophagus irregularis DAOM 181602=DAOM 197198]|uniref:Uncharacterized protein n=1 Tax=Rhizophagus irregularis (strain DAOM 181602 / DAOM 197198 / MUCL 43194) TaxID=747089 RepID=A0A2H5TR54_RHIID|nr:hypothetical protein GLOIN_2v1881823 [Rhizophagus irregularis DAOM 181602=DAOM 197198]XP_025180217.1 hypothetical protein GLOIN_2v1874455 [Rhizophagus irregularis DAOM 181602=DAOM 197198]POG63872.1 hypothetical protein GLOIN_2v1881823 [Rhizophagus irregularis DAOM 181602=DAOM 197198]POG73351.1 hypothetical protein GLOIN_2v1874455 [Rhizophagus irregularis DAOM 181602=DAOM 197198]|eukprot:XP_025170738.1 hypothetical protein GLOIN_2v1881823 [Rhizophagus irregularis DAOM 181602=DAOM 197198]